jgi:hypothetical protein
VNLTVYPVNQLQHRQQLEPEPIRDANTTSNVQQAEANMNLDSSYWHWLHSLSSVTTSWGQLLRFSTKKARNANIAGC